MRDSVFSYEEVRKRKKLTYQKLADMAKECGASPNPSASSMRKTVLGYYSPSKKMKEFLNNTLTMSYDQEMTDCTWDGKGWWDPTFKEYVR